MGDSLVEHENYRLYNLPLNNVHLVGRSQSLPASQLSLAERICGFASTSPGAIADDFQAANRQAEKVHGLLSESHIAQGILHKLATKWDYIAEFQHSQRIYMNCDHVPHKPDIAQGSKLSQPVPDLGSGYMHGTVKTRHPIT